jgi:hypothetical protein
VKALANLKTVLIYFFLFAYIQINVTYANTFTLEPLGERLNQCYKTHVFGSNPAEKCSYVESNIIVDFKPKIIIANGISIDNSFSSIISNNNCFFAQNRRLSSIQDLVYFEYYCKVSDTSLAVYIFGFYEKFSTVALHEINYLTCSHDNWSQLQKSLIDKFMIKGIKGRFWNNLPKSKDRGTDEISFWREDSKEFMGVWVDYSQNNYLKCPQDVKLLFNLRPFNNFPLPENPYLNALEALKREQIKINSSSQKPIF